MKKIALCSLLLCLSGLCCMSANAKSIHLSGNQDPWDAEFLYTSKDEYIRIRNDWKDTDTKDAKGNTYKQQMTNGTDYEIRSVIMECDAENYHNNTIAYVPGTGYIGNGDNENPTSGVFFRCEVSLHDYWVKMDFSDACAETDNLEKIESLFQANTSFATKIGESKIYFRVKNADKICKCDGDFTFNDKTMRCEKKEKDKPGKHCEYKGKSYNPGDLMETTECSNAPATSKQARTGKICYVSCMLERSYDTRFTTGIQTVWTVKECPKDFKEVSFDLRNGVRPADGEYTDYAQDMRGFRKCVKSADIDSCRKSRSTQEGKACCDLSASEAKWEDNQCKCSKENTKFEIVDGKGKCVAQGQEDDDSQPKNCKYIFEADVQCAGGQYVHIRKETMVSAMNCAEYNAKYGADKEEAMKYFGDLCTTQPKSNVLVLDSVAKLEQFKKYAESHRSGLKTKDGKFNTVRLASDISAGVVLGTVGGVVSGVVIKKKQLEKGYDALHCTVGGQTIADWGDEFVVGLQK